jgi:hypothetical protein
MKSPILEKKLRKQMRDSNCAIYDVNLPFRNAGRGIMAGKCKPDVIGKKHRRQQYVPTIPEVKDFARFLCGQTVKYFGPSFIVDNFLKWMKYQPRFGSRVAIFGLDSDCEVFCQAIRTMQSMGAAVASDHTNQQNNFAVNYQVRNVSDLREMFTTMPSNFGV